MHFSLLFIAFFFVISCIYQINVVSLYQRKEIKDINFKNRRQRISGTEKMKTLNEMTRKELAGRWFDLQVERGLFDNTNRARFINRCLNGIGASKPMRKDFLISCVENAGAALAQGK